MERDSTQAFRVNDEFARLERVIIGHGSPYQRDKDKVAAEMAEFPLVPDTDRRDEVLALSYPTEQALIGEYRNYVDVLERYGVEVLRADTDAAYSFDYTCPRDIGFVIGDRFFIANMAVSSRRDEIETIRQTLDAADPDCIVQPPADCLLEGGDVILLDAQTVLVGYHLRSNRRGFEFLEQYLSPLGYRVHAVPHRQLHLDCCLNPLGRGHMLMHRDSLYDLDAETEALLGRYDWISVDAVEREYLATNVLSIDPDTIIARDHPACARVNEALVARGYTVEAIEFDGVPATGGSFRCASLALNRSAP